MSAFWECHRRAFAHFGVVPKSIVNDRMKTVVRRHVAPPVTFLIVPGRGPWSPGPV